MKQKISELLTGYPEQEIDLEGKNPLSAARIRQRTMEAIAPRAKPAPRGRRILFRVLAAAAAISVLAMTAFAVGNLSTSEWFQSIMNSKQAEQQEIVSQHSEAYEAYTIQETVSQAQLELVDQLGEGFQPQTVESNDATMTLTAGYGDESVMHLYLQVIAPEGTVLPDDILYTVYSADGGSAMVTVGEGAAYDYVPGIHIELEALEDDDPTDNRKDFHLILTCQSAYELSVASDSGETWAKLNDGVEKYLNLQGLYSRIVNQDGDEDGYEPLLTGEFTFDITYFSEPTKYVLDVSNMTYGGHAIRQWSHPADVEGHFDWCPPYDENGVHTEEWDYTVTPTYFAITSMSVDWSCEYTVTDETKGYNLTFRVVMKDGTSPLRTFGSSSQSAEGDSSCGTSLFYNPIDLSEVDYILIGDEDLGSTYKLHLPE